MRHLGLRVTDGERSLAFYDALGYAELGRVPGAPFGSLTMLALPDDPFVSLELVHDPARSVPNTGAGYLRESSGVAAAEMIKCSLPSRDTTGHRHRS
jgi:catechol 2,3-dioxygenase-like lactoylglutathione lyase family enzyme